MSEFEETLDRFTDGKSEIDGDELAGWLFDYAAGHPTDLAKVWMVADLFGRGLTVLEGESDGLGQAIGLLKAFMVTSDPLLLLYRAIKDHTDPPEGVPTTSARNVAVHAIREGLFESMLEYDPDAVHVVDREDDGPG